MAKKTEKPTSKIPYDFDGARKIIELIKRPDDKLSVYTAIIKAHIEAGDLDAAEEVADESLRLMKQWSTKKQVSSYGKGYHIELIFRQFPTFKDKKLAIEIIREDEATTDKIKDFQFRCFEYIKMAKRFYALGETKLAEEMLEKTEKTVPDIRYDKQKPVILINIARLWIEKGNKKKAEAILQSAIDVAENLKNPSEALLEIAIFYMETGDLHRGIELIKRTGGKQAAYLESAIYRQLPNLIKAGFKDEIVSIIESFDDKKTKDNERIGRQFMLADAYQGAGAFDIAFQIVDKIRKENDITKESFPFYLLFIFLLKQDKFKEAEAVLDEAKRPEDHNIAFLLNLAGCQLERGKKSEAKRLIERAEKAVEKMKGAEEQHKRFLCVATAWARMGDKDAAKKAFEKAAKPHLERKENRLEATVEIGFYQWCCGLQDEARKSAQKAVEQARAIPTGQAIYYSGVVDLLLRLGETKTAHDLFDEVLKMVEKKGNEKGELDNNLMNFGLGLVCRKNDHQYSDPMKVLKGYEI